MENLLNQFFIRLKSLVMPEGQPAMPLLLALALLGLYMAASGIAGLIWPAQQPALSELERVKLEVAEEREVFRQQLRQKYPVYRLAFLERNLRPLVEETGRLLRRFSGWLGLGRSAGRELERELDLVGTGETVAGFYGQRVLSGVVLVAVGLACHFSGVVELSLLGIIALFITGLYLPSISLKNRVRRMREEALSQLPTFIDLLSINVQAGMGLENSIERVARMGKGCLPAAIRRAYDEARYRSILSESARRKNRAGLQPASELELVAIGLEEGAALARKAQPGSGRNLTFQALREMAERFRLQELDDFVAALETSDRQGVPVTETLQALAGLMREKKKARLIEAGSKSLVKMLLPVAVFILPAFILLLLTPALLQFMALSR